MKRPLLSTTNNLCIAWGFVMALITILDWNSLEKDPVNEVIITPFITREVTFVIPENDYSAPLSLPGDESDSPFQYQVELGFNGPLFLLAFFGPILFFKLLGHLFSGRNKSKTEF